MTTTVSAPVRLTRAQVREVDRLAVERYQVPGIVLMENAARNAADVAWEMLGRTPGHLVHILCGSGNNGGDGLAVARHLHNRGADVSVLLASEGTLFRGDALTNWRVVRAMQLECMPARSAKALLTNGGASLVIDALFGTGLDKPPRPDVVPLIEWVNASGRPILAIDLPSGLDCDSGQSLGMHCVRATRTVTFVAEKAGFANPGAAKYTGPVTVADIGCPKELIDQVLRDIRA